MSLDRYTTAFGDEIRTLATIDVGQMWDRYLGEFLQEWTRVQRSGASAAEIERQMQSFMESLSNKPVEDLARKSAAVAYNEGRKAETLTAAEEGQAEYVIRSAILDQNTCGPCSTLDGAAFEIDTDEYYANHPPLQCDGGDRCRCFYVVVPGELREAA